MSSTLQLRGSSVLALRLSHPKWSPLQGFFLAPSCSPLLSYSHTFFRPLSISSLTNFLSLLQPIHFYLNACLSCILVLARDAQELRDFTVLAVGLGL